MTDRIGVSKTSPSTAFYLESDITQSTATNQTTFTSYLRCVNTGGTSSFYGGAGSQTGSMDGIGTFGVHSAGSNFLPSGVGGGVTRWRNGAYTTVVGHDADGYHSNVVLRMHLAYGSIDTQHTYSFALPRISRPPLAPTAPVIGSTTSNSVALSWNVPDARGATITGYTVRYATNAGFTTDVGTKAAATNSTTVTGLTPGRVWYFKVLATNSVGSGAYSTASNVAVGVGGKRFDGSVFAPFTIAKRFDGAVFVDLTIAKRYDGSSWVNIS